MQDFLLDTDGDLKDAVTDIVYGESTSQHQQLLLITEKSAWKESPLVGVGARKFLENEDPAGLLAEIRKQFTTDGMTVSSIHFDASNKLHITASYN